MHVRTQAGPLDVHEAGPPDGPPVLLLHGFPQGADCWDAVVPALTAAQEGIWFAQQLDPGSAAFVTAEALELRGPVDLDLLARAIRTAVDEADGLHVRLVGDGPVPRQRPQTPGRWPLPVVDLRGPPSAVLC